MYPEFQSVGLGEKEVWELVCYDVHLLFCGAGGGTQPELCTGNLCFTGEPHTSGVGRLMVDRASLSDCDFELGTSGVVTILRVIHSQWVHLGAFLYC